MGLDILASSPTPCLSTDPGISVVTDVRPQKNSSAELALAASCSSQSRVCLGWHGLNLDCRPRHSPSGVGSARKSYQKMERIQKLFATMQKDDVILTDCWPGNRAILRPYRLLHSVKEPKFQDF